MKLHSLSAALAAALLALSTQALAQYGTERPADSAAQPSQPAAEEKKESSASTGSSAAPEKPGETFTRGESKRCESMTGADKGQCDKEEATKSEGPAAQDASKPAQDPSAPKQ
jgi:hypothetical protein